MASIGTAMNPWTVLRGVWQEHRLRRSLVGTLKPFLDRSRDAHGAAIERRWASDFGLGFLGTLITLTARRSVPDLGPEALGLVQVNGWAALTGLDNTMVGTRTMLLSLSQDVEFAAGCRAALAFDAALRGTWPDGIEDQVDDGGFPIPTTGDFAVAGSSVAQDLWTLWERLWSHDEV